MYSQEEVDTADELSSGADDDAIQARVSESMIGVVWANALHTMVVGGREGLP